MSDQICQSEHYNSTFILWKFSSIKLMFESAKLWYLKPGWENAPTARLCSSIFRSHPYGYNFYLNWYPYGFAAAIGTWVSVSLSISAGNYDDILPWPVSKTIQFKVRDQVNPLNAWSQTIESRPASADFSTVPTVRCSYFFPHTNLFNETDGFLHNDTMYLETSFLSPQYLQLHSLLFFSLFPRGPQSFSRLCQWDELSR